MKKILLLLSAVFLLSLSFLFAQAPPQLIFPINGQSVDPDQPTFQIEQLGWELSGTFEIYVDTVPIDPMNPGVPAYVGPLEPPLPGGRTLLEYHMADLMDEQAYYWFVKYSNGVDYWASVVQNFVTGVSTQTKYTIQGNIQSQSPLVSVGGVNITCPGACYPAWWNTSTLNSGYYKFQVIAGGTYTVTPNKAGHYFNPFSPQTYSNISANQTQNYWIISWNPNKSGLIYPGFASVNLPVMLPFLQWEYAQNPAYTMPERFTVWFGPMGASVPIEEIYYVVDGVYTYEFIPPDVPLEYGTTYEWKVVPTNDYGPAEGVETWTFTTEEDPYPPSFFEPVYPLNAMENVEPVGLIMVWRTGGKADRDWPVDSFFDVYLAEDQGPFEQVYSGPGNIESTHPLERFCYITEGLALDTHHHWYVRLTSLGIQHYSDIWDFQTAPVSTPPPSPVLHSPVNGVLNVPPGQVPLQWEQNPWQVDSFFDVYFDVNPINPDNPDPATLIFHGPGNLLRTYFEWHCAATMTQQTYYWFVRYSNFVDYWFSRSPVWIFTTGDENVPVELSSFNATVTAGLFVSLNWVVQSETNLLGYYVLRNETAVLADALTLNPNPITEGNVLGTQITYNYTDIQVEPDNTYFYWLNSVDMDGSNYFFGPVSVTITGDDPEEPIPEIPLQTELLSAYPNPFFTLSYIPFAMKTAGDVKIDIYNSKGQLIWTHSEKGKSAGYHRFMWDGKDLKGNSVSTGIYYYHMSSGKYSAGKKVVLMK